jgi:hypothetical protein
MGERIGEWTEADGARRRTWVDDGEIAVTEWKLGPGARIEGARAEPWTLLALTGSGSLVVDDVESAFGAGERRRVGAGRRWALVAGAAGLDAVEIVQGLAGRDLAGVRFGGRDLSAADLSGADLTGADLTGVDLEDACLAGADLSSARLVGLHAPGVDLSGARLARADLSGADLRGSVLAGADLSDANLARADLRDANLTGANLAGCDLTQADLREADCRGAGLADALRDHTRLDAAILDGTGLEDE